MIGALYKKVDAVWGRILESAVGRVFHLPVEATFNECVVCHWWRGATLGAAVGFGLSGHWVVALALFATVALIVVGQAAAATEDGTEG